MKKFAMPLLASFVLSACATNTVPNARIIERLPATEAAAPPPPPLPPLRQADLLPLVKQGLAAENIIARLKESRTRLRLSASDVLSLKTQGVPVVVLDHLLDSDRQASADECAVQINKRDEEARTAQQQAVQQAEMMGWQRCQLSYPMMPFPVFRPFPYRR